MFLCSSCHRHVREAKCPFCGASQGGQAVAGPRAYHVGVTRSALLASAVAAALGAVACGGAVEPGAPAPAPKVVQPAPAPTPTPAPERDSGIQDAAPADEGAPDTSIADTSRPCDEDVVVACCTDYGMPPPNPCRDRD